MSKIERLIDCGLRALQSDRHLLVRVRAPKAKALEIIINPPVDILRKLNYYKNAYTEDLKLKANTEVEIVDFMEYDIDTHQVYYNEGDVNEEYIIGEDNNDKK